MIISKAFQLNYICIWGSLQSTYLIYIGRIQNSNRAILIEMCSERGGDCNRDIQGEKLRSR